GARLREGAQAEDTDHRVEVERDRERHEQQDEVEPDAPERVPGDEGWCWAAVAVDLEREMQRDQHEQPEQARRQAQHHRKDDVADEVRDAFVVLVTPFPHGAPGWSPSWGFPP